MWRTGIDKIVGPRGAIGLCQRKEPWPSPSQGPLRSSCWNERLQATDGGRCPHHSKQRSSRLAVTLGQHSERFLLARCSLGPTSATDDDQS